MNDQKLEPYDLVNNISDKTMKVGSVLRLLQDRLLASSSYNKLPPDDLIAAIEVCLETLPHASDDISDPLENHFRIYGDAIKNAEKSLEQTRTAFETVCSAMRGIANPTTPVDTLTEAGMALYDLAQANLEYEAQWNAWLEIVELRGYAIGWLVGPHRKWLHLTAAGLPELKKAPTPDSARHIVVERLSADDIELISDAMAGGVKGFLMEALRRNPEPIDRKPESQHSRPCMGERRLDA